MMSVRGAESASKFAVLPAQAGIQKRLKILDSRLRGNDD